MLLRLELELRRRADLAQLDLLAVSSADRHVVGRHIGNGGEQILQRSSSSSRLLRLAVADRAFELRHLVHQALGADLVLARPWPGRSSSRRRCGAPAPPAISESSRGVARPASEFDSGFAGLEAAIGQPLDEGVLVLANPFDVEHRLSSYGWNSRLPYKAPAPSLSSPGLTGRSSNRGPRRLRATYDYWMPAFAGMTNLGGRNKPGHDERP